MICIIRRIVLTLFQKDGSRLVGIQLVELLKLLFGIRRHVYLDYNATTIASSNVRKRMKTVLKKYAGNPSSLHESGKKAAEVIEVARRNLAETIHADPSEIIFTGCATESNNTVLKSLFDLYYPEKRRIISLPIEHPSVINTMKYLRSKGLEIMYCPVAANGRVQLDVLEKMIDDSTFLICCMLANNEIGTIQDVRKVVEIASKRNVRVFSDCVQAFGKIPVDVKSLGMDYASFSAHKVYGPKGVGALYVKKGSPVTPLLHGGHQEQGFRAGTEAVHAIAGFGEASRFIDKHAAHYERLQKLKQILIKEVKRMRPDCVVYSPETECLSNTISLRFPGIKNEILLGMLNYYGIEVSAGSACSSGEDKPSYVLKSIGLSDDEARETIRVSMGSFTTNKDIRYMIKVLNSYFKGKALYVNNVSAEELKRKMFSEPGSVVVLDIRPEFQRKKLPGPKNFTAIHYSEIEKNLHCIPRNKHIVIACETGKLSFVTAYTLKSKGYTFVSSLKVGIRGWNNQ
ncbi:MAG TPA: aminotransferase class V-fold PLP-dependent enzyme [Chitinispirillaceae bacterium]|nr:aminotransferase class V-fold PLP-dependent enzyme [Chitinispirillaceae bacterium]